MMLDKNKSKDKEKEKASGTLEPILSDPNHERQQTTEKSTVGPTLSSSSFKKKKGLFEKITIGHSQSANNSNVSSSNVSPSSVKNVKEPSIPKNHSVGNIKQFLQHIHHRKSSGGQIDNSHLAVEDSGNNNLLNGSNGESALDGNMLTDVPNASSTKAGLTHTASTATSSSKKGDMRKAGSFKDVWDAVSHFHLPSVRSSHKFEDFNEGKTGSHKPHYKFQDLEDQILNFESFSVIKQLGSGTFGKVYQCKHNITGEVVVVKAIDKGFIVNSGQMEHIKEEKETLKLLSQHDCPFTVTAVACFQDKRMLYFVMEYLPGGELFAHLNGSRNHRFSEKRARFYIGELIIALKYMHEKEHIVYRDIKPENMLLDKKGHLKVIDFGFAKHLMEEEKTYTFCGTPDYLAPEVIRGDGYNYEADLWSLGVFIYELIVGNAPFQTVYEGKGKNAEPRVDYRSILAGQFTLPGYLSGAAKDIIISLLQVDRRYRLGAKRGLIEVMEHPWFEGIDWGMLERKEIKAPKLHKYKKGLVNIQGRPSLDTGSKDSTLNEADQQLFKQFDFIAGQSSEEEEEEEPQRVENCHMQNNSHVGLASAANAGNINSKSETLTAFSLEGEETTDVDYFDDTSAVVIKTCRDSKIGISDMDPSAGNLRSIVSTSDSGSALKTTLTFVDNKAYSNSAIDETKDEKDCDDDLTNDNANSSKEKDEGGNGGGIMF